MGVRRRTEGKQSRGTMRRRLRRQQRVREALLLDLGALVFELHRHGRREPELLQAKAAELTAVDDEVRALSEALGAPASAPQLKAPGSAANCPNCGALLATDARFCSSCGAPTGVDGTPPASEEDEAPTMEADAVEAVPVDEAAADESGPGVEEGIVSVGPMARAEGAVDAEAEPVAEADAEAEPAAEAEVTPEAQPESEAEQEPEVEPAADPDRHDDAEQEPAPEAASNVAPAAGAPAASKGAAEPRPPKQPQPRGGENLVEEAQRLARVARRRAREWLDRQRASGDQ